MLAVVGVIAASLIAAAPPAGAVAPPEYDWVAAFGAGQNDDWGDAVATDDAGNVYAVGTFGDTVDFDPGPGVYELTASPNVDVFVWKSDRAGNLVWARSVGGFSEEGPSAVTVDDDGNVYVVGWFRGTADFDPGPGTFTLTSSAIFESFVLKLDANGGFLWARQTRGLDQVAGQVYLNDVAVDGAGNVTMGGNTLGAVDLDPGPGTSILDPGPTLLGDGFIWRLDANGDFVWAEAITGPEDSVVNAVAVDETGNVYGAGWFRGTADFDPGPGTFPLITGPNPDTDGFVWKLSNTGDFQWVSQLAGSGNAFASGLTMAPNGNLVAVGEFTGAVDFDPGPGTQTLTASTAAGYVITLDTAGALVWAVQVGDPEILILRSDVAVDVDGNIYTTGIFDGTIDFDPGPGAALLSTATNAIFVLKLSSTGAYDWAFSLDQPQFEPSSSGIAVDPYRNVSITGAFHFTVDFDPGPGTASRTANQRDAFIAHYTQNAAPATPVDVNPTADAVAEDAAAGSPVGITASAVDSDGDLVTYTLSDDAGGRFAIDPATGVVTVADASLLDGPASHTITVVAADHALSSSASFTVAVTNVAPHVAVSASTAAGVYSDPVGAVTITASDVAGDPLAATAVLPDAGTITGGLTLSGTGGGGAGTWTLGGVADLAPGTHPVTVTVTDGDGGAASTQIDVVVAAEDATAAFASTNPSLVTADGEGDSGLFSLDVTLTENPDGYPGDIEQATLSVELVPIGPGASVTTSCTSLGSGNRTCSFDDVPVNGYFAHATIGGFYTGSGESLLVVGDPSGGFVTGGGWYTNGQGERVNLGFVAKYKKGTVKGNINLVRHAADGPHRVKAGGLTALAVGSSGGVDWAVFTGVGSYRPAHGGAIDGCDIVVYVEDDGGLDRIWVRARCNGTPVDGMSMAPSAVVNAIPIGGGNIAIHD